MAESPSEVPAYQYASIQQIVEGRENIEYILDIREQPKQSRMCGVGEKADRRPIDPAPIIQLRVITHPQPIREAPSGAEGRDEADDAAKSPKRASRADSVSSALKNRPKDGESSLPQLRRGDRVVTEHGEGWEDKGWYLENPYYFMCAMLADAERDEELHLLSDGKTRYTTGSCVSCLYHLKDIDGSHQGFFVFPDLSIRVEGRYRLKLCLFETIGNEVHHCKSIYTSAFMVYTAKRFPGMEESTKLSRTFADQGLKVRVRKNPRGKRSKRDRSTGGHGGSEEDDEHFLQRRESMAMGLGMSQPKRLRSDSWLSAGSGDYPMAAGYGSVPYRQTSPPRSPQMGWSNGQAGSLAQTLGRGPAGRHTEGWHAGATGVPGEAYRSLPPPHQRVPDLHDPRPPGLPAHDDFRQTRYHSVAPPGVSHDASWQPPNSMLPPSRLTPPYQVSGPSPIAPTSSASRGSSRARRLSPPAPSGPVMGGPLVPSSGLTAASSLASRQRSVSSAAAFSPRPWDSRPMTSGHGSGGAAPHISRAYPTTPHGPLSPSGATHYATTTSSPTGKAPQRGLLPFGGPRVHSLSQHGAHNRERSLSDPRTMMTSSSSRESGDLPRLARTSLGSRAAYETRPTLPPLQMSGPASGHPGGLPGGGYGRPGYTHATPPAPSLASSRNVPVPPEHAMPGEQRFSAAPPPAMSARTASREMRSQLQHYPGGPGGDMQDASLSSQPPLPPHLIRGGVHPHAPGPPSAYHGAPSQFHPMPQQHYPQYEPGHPQQQELGREVHYRGHP
ncbi:unnamed protein product [Parajaminaea phylloscopi]